MSSDVWSVGCCIIMMATGQPPWIFHKSQDPYFNAVKVSVIVGHIKYLKSVS